MPAPSFSHSKIEKMKKLASVLSKKISATVQSTSNKDKSTNNDISENKKDEQNNNSGHIETVVAENDVSENKTIFPNPIGTQDNLSICNEDSNTNLNTDVERNTKNNDMYKDVCEQDVASTNCSNVEEEDKSASGDNKTTSVRKRKKHKKDSNKNISAIFEGERVSCLIGRRLGRSNEEEESVSTADDDYVLRKLFSKSSKFST